MPQKTTLDIMHNRYCVQAGWTAVIRKRLYHLADLQSADRILEVGSGTGVITEDLTSRFKGQIFGLDIDSHATAFAHERDRLSLYLIGDGVRLPFPENSFDASICHFLLLWVLEPGSILSEMARVTRPEGWVMALAEPDYGGRIDYPETLVEIGELQVKSLAAQGSDPMIGRKLRSLFNQSKLEDIQAGVLGGEWIGSPLPEELDSEWSILAADLHDLITDESLDAIRSIDQEAWRCGNRILYVPTFYACGRVSNIES